MSDVVIENPVINSPFEALRRHFKFGNENLADHCVEKLAERVC